MQDIDFDEIDRAVSSITNPNTEGGANSSFANDRNPLDGQPVIAPSEAPMPTPSTSSPVSPVASPAVRRSAGRFMDVVHPSSDMRPSESSASSAPSAPSAPSLHREEVADRPVVTQRPEPSAVASSAFHWPDPVTVARPAPAPAVETTAPVVAMPAPEPISETIPEVVPSVPEVDSASLESPFLTDTKVEKRPLGAFSGADADLPLLEDPIPFSGDNSAQSKVVVVEEPAHEEHETVPDELHEALLALEGHDKAEPLLQATNPPDVIPTPVVDEAPVGPTSITQQYQEQPNTMSQTAGSIFDTEAYHQALTHPPKKLSKVLILVWILVLILVGGGIGTAFYFFVLPMLG